VHKGAQIEATTHVEAKPLISLIQCLTTFIFQIELDREYIYNIR